MFWKFLSGTLRFSLTLQRTVTALGAATIIIVGVHDYLKQRRRIR